MREIYRSAVVIFVSAVIIMIGCGCDTNDPNSFTSISDSVSFPENVTVSFDEPKSFPQKCNVYSAERKIFSEEDFEGIFNGTPQKETNAKGFTLDLDS